MITRPNPCFRRNPSPKYQPASCPVLIARWLSKSQSYIRNRLAQSTSKIRRPISCSTLSTKRSCNLYHTRSRSCAIDDLWTSIGTIAKGPPSPMTTDIIVLSAREPYLAMLQKQQMSTRQYTSQSRKFQRQSWAHQLPLSILQSEAIGHS